MRLRTMSIGLVALLALAACSTGESAVPGADPSTDLAAPDSLAGQATSGTSGTSNTRDPTTTSAGADPPATGLSEAPSATNEVDPVAATDLPLDPVADACNSLESDGYETRKLTRQRLADDALDAALATCGDALARLDGAVEIEQRMAAFAANPAPLTATDLVCDAGSFSLTITNDVDHPIGVHASMRLVRNDTDGPVGSTLQPLVIWSLEPAASTVLTGQYQVNRGSDEGLTCEVDVTAFDATPGNADASLGETRVAALAVDDPAAWLPFLVAQGAAVIGTGDADLAAVVEDVRSTEYPSVVRLVLDGDAEPIATGTISVCSASIEQPSERLMSIVYFDDTGDSSRLQHGVFRRGDDDQWRWLGSSVYFDSQEYWNCGKPSSNL